MAVGIYLLLLALYLATAAGHFFSTDEVAVYQTAQSIAEHGNLEISPIQNAVPRNGKWYSQYEPGQSVASIPLYVAGSVIDRVSPPSVRAYFSGHNYSFFRGLGPPGSFSGTVPIFFVSHFNQLLTPLLCVLIYLFCLKLGFSLRASFATAIVYGVGTLAWPQAEEYFQHPLETFFLLSAVYVLTPRTTTGWRRQALRPRDALLAGTLLACGLQTRFNLVVTVPLLFGYLAWLRLNAIESQLSVADRPGSLVSRVRAVFAARGWGVLRGEWRYIALFAVPLAVALGLTLWLAHFRTGDWLAIHGGGRGAEANGGFSPANIPAGLAGLLLSPGRSLFLYSPPVLAGLFAFRRFWKEHTDVAVLFLGIALAYLLLYSSFQYWHGGVSWGPRYLLPALPFLVIPAAYLFERKTSAILLGLLTALGAGISLLGVTINIGFAWFAVPVQYRDYNYLYLWTIDQSPIVLHFKDFFAGRFWDLWLQFVLHNQGTAAFTATVCFLALIVAAGLIALRGTGLLSWPTGGGRSPSSGESSISRQDEMSGARAPDIWPVARAKSAIQWLLDAADRRGRLFHLPFLAFVVLATLLASIPLFSLRPLSGHHVTNDALVYIPRNVEFYQGLKAGQIFPRWGADLAWGYGEPTFNYNPPVFYYLSSFFHFAGFAFTASEDMSAFVLLLSAGIGMYFLSQQFFGRWGGLVSGVAYVVAPYVLLNLYVRHDMADFSAFAFMPWALWGVYRYTRANQFGFLLLSAAGTALVFLSSASVALFFAPTLALFAVWTAWHERSRLALLRAGWCLLLGVGLAAFFLLPALLEQNLVHFERQATRFDYQDFLYIQQFFWGTWGYGLSLPGPNDGLSFALGPVHLLATAAAGVLAFRLRRSKPQVAWTIAFFLAVLGGAVFFCVSWSVFVWDALPILHHLQFPWRFLSLAALATSFLCAAPLLAVPANRRGMLAAAAVGMVILLLAFNIGHAHPESFLNVNESDYSPHNIAAKGIPASAREFEPIWSTQFPPERPAAQKLEFMTGRGNIVTNQLSPYYYRYFLNVGEPSLVRINTFYFPGWQLTIDGQQTAIQHDNPYGLIQFMLPKGGHLVELRWGSTRARTWGTWLSALALLLLVATPWLSSHGPGLLRRARHRSSFGSFRFFGRAGGPAGTPPGHDAPAERD